MNHNIWLAEMGYLAYCRTLGTDGDLDTLPPADRRGWLQAAAAIRRRVVKWGLSAEEDAEPDDAARIEAAKALLHQHGYGVVAPPNPASVPERNGVAETPAPQPQTWADGYVPERGAEAAPAYTTEQRYIPCTVPSCQHLGSMHMLDTGQCMVQGCQAHVYMPAQHPQEASS